MPSRRRCARHTGAMRFAVVLGIQLAAAVTCVACSRSSSGEPGPAASSSSSSSVSDARAAHCRDAARACAAALLAGDDGKIVDCMAPEALASSGGRAAVMAELQRGRAEMAKDGVSFAGSEIDLPRDMAPSGGRLYAIVPQVAIMKVPEGHLRQSSFLVGVSSDDGATWKFLDAAGLKGDRLRRLLPQFPASLTLPNVPDPQLVP